MAAVVAAVASVDTEPAHAQSLNFRSQLRPAPPPRAPETGQQQMLLQATEIQYDYPNERVSAVGNVQVYYKGTTVEADKVIYDQRTKHLHAEGNVRITAPDGQITYGELIDLSDDLRNGFIDSLRIETIDQTRFAAARGKRAEGNFTVLESGVYTACQPCREDPRKPPLWQVKAARIIHDQSEKMVYFEDAKLEFFGVPLLYTPYLAAPDPTVKRKSGFLMPLFTTSSLYGFSVQTPYYLALAPNYDMTIAPRIMSKQGPLMDVEWRHRLDTGAYTIRTTGVYQMDKQEFVGTDAFKTFRGSVETSGRFNLSPRWTWGWDGVLVSDPTYFADYKIRSLQSRSADLVSFFGQTEGISQLFLVGRGTRSYFDARTIHYTGFTSADQQDALPIIHPVVDYQNTFDQPLLGGEFGYNINMTSLSRDAASFDAISQVAVTNNLCNTTSADPALKTSANCLLRGVPGNYSRLSGDVHWRSRFIDPLGQVFTPFFSMRGDVAQVNVNSDIGVNNFIETGESNLTRTMPTAGIEYRYPFISVHSWGTQTIEPIAQIIARPSETNIGRLPNEDAQSLVFDDSNLFKVDKFSGWDRIEGGGRANAGLQYIAQFNGGGSVNMLFGQSYHLFGTNSFAVGDTTNTGLGSGLDKPNSDYVARFAYAPNRIFNVISRYRFAEEDFTLKRFEVEGRTTVDRWSVALLYGNYAAQPELGFLEAREGLLAQGSIKLTANWVLNGAARYDIKNNNISQTQVGLGYIDDCLLFGLTYVTDYTYSTSVPESNHTVLLQFGLRTLGSTNSSGLGSSSASSLGTLQ
ncbi:MAG: LPS-assembly protein LptD [Xanthobacteraceae bacterium]